MPRFQLSLPNGTLITYGVDRFMGFFCEAHRGHRRLLDYDFTTPGYTGLPGLLDALVSTGIFTRDQVEAGLEALLRVQSTEEIQDEYARTVAVMAHKLKEAAGE